MGRSPCCDKNGLKKGPWTPEEDEKLINYIKKHGQGTWRTLPKKASLNRCGKSCRLRWNNYLKPDIKRGMVTEEEELIILELHSVLGNKWSKIAAHLPGRTDNEIKNHWNTKMRRKLLKVGIDPQTHKPVVPDINQILHYSHLISALNPATNLMNMLTNLLLSQVDPTQLAKLQLLQKLLTKTVNVSGQNNLVPSPNGSTNGAGAGGLGITELFLTMMKSSDIGQILCGNNSSSGTSNATTVSPPNASVVNSLGSTTSSSRTEDSVATLMCDSTATPKASSLNIVQPNPTQAPLATPSAIDIFQNWDELMENEAFWKDFTV